MSPRPPSEVVLRKGRRLIRENRVQILDADLRPTSDRRRIIARVQGDRGIYLTAVLGPVLARLTAPAPSRFCTCEAGRAGEHTCSHEAALLILLGGSQNRSKMNGRMNAKMNGEPR